MVTLSLSVIYGGLGTQLSGGGEIYLGEFSRSWLYFYFYGLYLYIQLQEVKSTPDENRLAMASMRSKKGNPAWLYRPDTGRC